MTQTLVTIIYHTRLLWGWKEGSLVKSAHCSCQGPEFSPQHPHPAIHSCLDFSGSVALPTFSTHKPIQDKRCRRPGFSFWMTSHTWDNYFISSKEQGASKEEWKECKSGRQGWGESWHLSSWAWLPHSWAHSSCDYSHTVPRKLVLSIPSEKGVGVMHIQWGVVHASVNNSNEAQWDTVGMHISKCGESWEGASD